MAYVKVLRGRNIFDLNKYILTGRDQSDPYLSNLCFSENVADQMYSSQILNGKRDMDAIHVVQSFDQKDSKKLSPEEYTKIGFEMTKKMFPEHQFIVVTHTDTEQTHNHIMINPYHPESGRKILNKKRLLYDLRDLSDKCGAERGLSVIKSQSILNWEDSTETVRAIKKRGGFSWVIDLQEKCDFARKLATSFDEYAGILNQLDIQVRVENKNIQYIYPNRRSKRGGTKGLGEKYTKDGLVDTFKENYQKFFGEGLKTKPIDKVDFNDHWKFQRSLREYIIPEYRYKDVVIPIDVLKKVKSLELKEFCNKNDIPILEKDDGFVLKEKPNIYISGSTWMNLDKKTSGTPLEFISYLKKQDFLKTLGEFDKSKKIEKLNSIFDLSKPSFQAFYLKPEVKIDDFKEQKKILKNLGFSTLSLSSLLRLSKIKALSSDKVKCFAENKSNLSLTFYKISDEWVCRKHQGLNHFFYKNINVKNKKTLVFEDPIGFLKNDKVIERLKESSFPYNVVVPLKPVGLFLKENASLFGEKKDVYVVKSKEKMIWGNSSKSKEIEEDLSKILFEKNIGYQSIDDLLKDMMTRSRDL